MSALRDKLAGALLCGSGGTPPTDLEVDYAESWARQVLGDMAFLSLALDGDIGILWDEETGDYVVPTDQRRLLLHLVGWKFQVSEALLFGDDG